ncbi:MAG: efflux RND transporter permease subunit, partial [Saprospiraceae bacterium]|nr:efflux RND transporter permease subunit [Saprospiraceae bacterium]
GSVVERFFSRLYHSILKKTLAFPRSIIVSVLALFVFSMIVLSGLGRSFLPDFNEDALVISVVTPPGTSLEESGKTGKLVEEILLEFPEINITSRRTGRAEMDEHAQSANSSEVEVPFKLKDRNRDEFLDDIRKKLSIVPGASITIGMPIAHRIDHMLSGTRANIAIKIFGPELNRLFTIANKVKSAIEQTGGLVDVNVEQLIEVPQIRIIPNRVILAKYGIKLGDFMDFIDVAFAGETVGQVFEGERAYDLVVRFNEQNRSNIEAIRNCLVDTETNEKIPLHYVANVINDSNPHNIGRENVQRKIVVSGNVSGRDLRSVVNDIQSRIDKEVTFPEGYRVEFGGQFENEAKATRMLMLTSIGAVIIIFLLLFLEFRILRLAGIVILNLPLALIGGIFSVYFTSGIISIASTIGFISLFGIAARNGILLISRYRFLEQQGMNLKDTILNGSLDRLNPILMTALTTGLALIPLAVASHQAGSEIQSPMAVVILGGLISSTILNLVVIPAIYSLK